MDLRVYPLRYGIKSEIPWKASLSELVPGSADMDSVFDE